MFNPCLLVPVYEHHRSVPRVLDALRPLRLQCVLVDDGSSAECAAALQATAGREGAWVTLLRHDVNCGKGAAVLTGMRHASGEGYTHALQVDADAQHDMNAAGAFIDTARANPLALVCGVPVYDDSVPAARLHGRRLTTFWVHVNTLSRTAEDAMCGFRVYPLAVTLTIADAVDLGDRMEFDIEVLVRLQWAGFPLVNLPVAVTYPVDGISHFRMWRDNVRISLTHTRLFFGMLWRIPRLLSRRAPRRSEHWARIGEAGSVTGLRLLYQVHRLLGRAPFMVALAPVMLYFLLRRAAAREASLDYLRRVFPQAGRWRLVWLSYRHFSAFGECLLDKALVWTGWLPARLEFRGMDPLWQRLHVEHRGALVLVSHLGNLELSRALAKLYKDIPLMVLVHTKNAANFNRFLASINPENAVDLLQVTEVGVATAIELRERIASGYLVVIAADRVPVGGGARVVRVPFLGADAAFPVGPHVLASLLDCPVWLMFSLRDRHGHALVFEPFAEQVCLPRRDRAGRLRELAARYAQRLEYHCRLAPLQWFNFYSFWSNDEPR